MNNNTNTQSIIAQIVANVTGASFESVDSLIEATNGISSCRFASISGYSSDATDNTEVANHVVNFGFIYSNMKAKDIACLVQCNDKNEPVDANGIVIPNPIANLHLMVRKVNVADINVSDYDYSRVNTGKLTLAEYQREVDASLTIAYNELIASALTPSGSSGREDNDVWLNRVLVFNTKTQQLCMIGESISKTVEVEAELKQTKKGAKTFAKDIIKYAAKIKTNSYRRFKISNLNSTKINGETIEIA